MLHVRRAPPRAASHIAPHRSPGAASAVLAILVALIALAPAPSRAAPPQGTPATPAAPAADTIAVEPVILDLHVGRLVSQTVSALRRADDALLPVGALLAMAELRHAVASDGAVTGTIEPGGRAFRVAADSGASRLAGRRIGVGSAQAVVHEGELYASTTMLAELLGVRFAVSWADLNVTIVDPEPLPVARRLEREEGRRRLLQRRLLDSAGADRLLPLDRPRWDGLVVDYAATAPAADPARGGAFSLGAGADLFGGSLEGSVASIGRLDDGRMRVQGSWLGVWDEHRWLRQLRVGDALSTGTHLRPLRGITVSNSPFVRPAVFGRAPLRDVLQPGWEVELYRDGQLVAFDSADALGVFALHVPVQYGVNPFEVMAYGPFGEVRRFDRSYFVAEELLRTGATEYGASFGECAQLASCRRTGNLDLRHGLSARWTVRGGSEWLASDRRERAYPYAAIAGNPIGALSVQLEAMPGALGRADVRFEPSTRFRLAASVARYDPALGEPMLAPPGRRGAWNLAGYARPAWLPGTGYLFGEAERIDADAGDVTRARLGTSLQGRHGQLLVYGRTQRDVFADGSRADQDFLGLNGYLLPPPRWGRLFARAWLRGTLELRDASRPALASATFARTVRRGVRVETGGSWTRQAGASALLLVAADLGSVRAYTTVTVPRHGEASATQVVQGSVLWDRASGVLRTTPGPSLQRAGIAGRVFLDVDGDGRFGPADEAVRGAFVRVGTSGAISDSLGRYHVWDVSPFSPVPVELDSLTLPSPLWVQRDGRLAAVPGPNRFRPLDVVVAPGGELEGYVVLETHGVREGVPGARLSLRDPYGATRPLTTFGDGGFSAIALRPGAWRVEVDARDIARLEARGAPHDFTIRALPDGDRVVVEIVLESTKPPPALAVPEIAIEAPAPAVVLELPTLDALRPLLDSAGARVVLHDILFAHDSDRLQLQAVPTLTAIGELLASRPELSLRIEGHTDAAGSDAYNRALSARRAAAVRRWLLERHDIAPARLVSRGHGESRPIATNLTADGRRLNRRVELVRLTAEEAAREAEAAASPARGTRPGPRSSSPRRATPATRRP